MTDDEHSQRLSVLLVEDSPSVARLYEIYLCEGDPETVTLHHVTTLADAMSSLHDGGSDVVLLDLGLPDSEGLQTYVRLREAARALPIVVCTALGDENLAFAALRLGAQEYLTKSEVSAALLKRTIRYAVQRKRFEEELRESHERLREATAHIVHMEKVSALAELSAGVAHELNQPLNAVNLGLQMMARSWQNLTAEEIAQDLEELQKLVRDMAAIIDHMRLLTRRSDDLRMLPCDFNVPITRAMDMSRQHVMGCGIELREKLTVDLPEAILDAVLLEQVFLNLITNARDALCDVSYRPKKTIDVRSYSVTDPQGNLWLACAVRDNGNGIPAELHERIFLPFVTTKPSGQGTGLGLSVSRRIVQAHHGRLELTANQEGGTTFSVFLPVQDGKAPGAQEKT